MSPDPFQRNESDSPDYPADDSRSPTNSASSAPKGSAESDASSADVPYEFDVDSLDAGFAPPTDELTQLREQLKEAEARVLRAQAEIENIRRRARREIDDERKFANLPLLTDLLPVVDNMDRAMQAAEKTSDAAALLQGFQMLSQQLLETLAKHHCCRIPALGTPFDPQRHAAIQQQPSQEHPSGVVVLVAQEGYQLYDRVIRPTQVIVSTGPPV